MGRFTRTEQALFVTGVLTTGLIVRGFATCEVGSPGVDTKDFSSLGAGKCFDAIGGDDRITGSAYDDSLQCGAGEDYVTAGAGADSVYGEGGADELYGGSGADELHGSADSDVSLDGGTGDDEIYAGGGSDVGNGAGGDDLIEAQGGADSIGGEAGGDELNAGAGADQVFAGGAGGGGAVDILRDNVTPTGTYVPDGGEDTLDAKDQDSMDTIYAGENDSICADSCDWVEVRETTSPYDTVYVGYFGDATGINMTCTPGSCE